MSDFKEVMKQRIRMTQGCNILCEDCNLDFRNNGFDVSCVHLLNQFPEIYEEIVMRWAKKHPLITNADKFKEVFGLDANINNCCISVKYECDHEKRCRDCDYSHFWNREYQDPKKGE